MKTQTRFNRLVLCCALILAASGPVSPVFGQTDLVDRSFGTDGYAILDDQEPIPRVYGSFVQPDGKIVTVGEVTLDLEDRDFFVARMLPDGSRDEGFGNGGIVITDTGQSDNDRALLGTTGMNGQLIVAGLTESTVTGNGGISIVRYNEDGSVDESFGVNGVTMLSPLGNTSFTGLHPTQDGGVLVGGSESTTFAEDVVVARVDRNGLLDADFASGGVYISYLGRSNQHFIAPVVRPDGRILAGLYGRGDENASLLRLNPDGSLDTSFGVDGRVDLSTDPGTVLSLSDVELTTGGSVLLAASVDNSSDNLIYRFDEYGNPDGSWGVDGLVRQPLGINVGFMFLEDSGRILFVGPYPESDDIVGVRGLMADGSPDPSLNDLYDIDLPTDLGGMEHAALAADGKILITGNGIDESNDYESVPFVLRLDAGRISTASQATVDELPAIHSLKQNYPNPFNPSTTLRFSLESPAHARVAVVDLHGREVAVVADRRFGAGTWSAGFDASGLASGVYVARLDVDGRFVEARQMVFLK